LHIVQRGHNRQPCFYAEEDYYAFSYWLNDALVEYGCALHAYVLMTNHVHLLLTPQAAANIPGLLISLGRRYVQYVNRTYGRTGTLWDSRYKSSLVQADHYLLACHRYIELNPVRAGMTEDPAHYQWSSYRANGLGRENKLLSPHPLYLGLGDTAVGRQASYRSLFRSELDQAAVSDVRLALAHNRPLGNERFREEIERVTGISCKAEPPGRPRENSRTAAPC
jgi:putative transposase